MALLEDGRTGEIRELPLENVKLARWLEVEISSRKTRAGRER